MGLDAVELIMAWEQEFEISISDASSKDLSTPRHAVHLIEILLLKEGRPAPRHEIEAKVKEITIEQLGIRKADYHIDADFSRDLGMS